MSERYYLPAITITLLNDHIVKCQNLALILDKYPPAHVPGNSQEKSEWLRRLGLNTRVDPALTKSAFDRWSAMMSALHATRFNAVLEWRMVIGLGGETILETDITLHHLYGIPFIPGSALKGLTRGYVTGEIEEYKSSKIDDDNEGITRIFGSQGSAGTVIFFDAMPVNGQVEFVLDIMNPHYPDYYRSLQSNRITPPTNDQQPNPVTFLTVTNTTFTFALAPRNPNKDQHTADVDLVKTWLQEALQKYGVGGKTSAGYGYFNIIDDRTSEQLSKPAEKTFQAKPAERIRPNLPVFKEGQEIPGLVVIAPTDELRQRVPAGSASAFLRYREFSTRDVFVVISEKFPEAQSWRAGDTRNCIFTREERHDDYVVWFCKPRTKRIRTRGSRATNGESHGEEKSTPGGRGR